MTESRAQLFEVERALERLFRLSMGRKEIGQQAAAVGVVVSRAGYAVLRSLTEHGEQTLGGLAHATVMDPAAAARQVSKLEDQGFVERSATSVDGRLKLVRITERGEDVYRRIVDVRIRYLAQALADWNASEFAELSGLIDRLVDAMATTPFGAVLADPSNLP